MKKTISINISGQVFNIEEDGYDKLKNYLGAITKYFSSYGDSKEILTDIEGRIAEKFLDYLKKEEKQAVSSENVENLIASMGTVADFEAIKEDEDLYEVDSKAEIKEAADFIKAEGNPTKPAGETAPEEPIIAKKLYRDSQRKILGGVCAGMAHYFGVDPIWVRLLFLGCLGFIPVLAVFSAFVFILYIACWIAFPANADLKEDEKIKKFFRDPDRKVLAGVAAGVSKYTGIDLAIVRLLFVITIPLAATGIMVYLILWAITPFAKTITDKMQMKGEAITLENIESNIKSAKSTPGQESTIATILLFPFRILGKIFSALGPLFQFALIGVRIFAGLLLIIIGGSVLVALVTALFSSWGMFGDLPIGVIDNVPMHIIAKDAPNTLFFFLFFAIAIPFLALAMAGFTIITRKNIFNSTILQTLGGLWLMGILGASISASKFAVNFKRNGTIEKTLSYQMSEKTPTLDISDNEGWENYHDVNFDLEPATGNEVEVLEKFEARGATTEIAQKNASLIKYNIKQTDSLLVFDRTFELDENAGFRNQELRTIINIPKEKVFYLSREFAGHMNINIPWETINWEIKANRIKNKDAARFKFNQNGDLECIDKNPEATKNMDENGNYFKEFPFNNFEEMEFAGNIEVEIVEAQNSKITVHTENDNNFNDFKFEQMGSKIVGKFHENNGEGDDEDKMYIKIEMPKFGKIKLADQTFMKINNTNQIDLKISMSNQAKLEIAGKSNNLELEIHDNAEFKGDDFEADNVKISSYNQASVVLIAKENIKAEAFDQSKIEYSGSPKNIQLSPNGESEISKKSDN